MKTVVVTGSAGGIGKAICRLFHENGYKVIGIDRQTDDVADWEVIRFDIGLCHDAEQLGSLCRQIDLKCDGSIDALVNNAAVQIVKPVEEITSADWDETLNINLLAPFWLTQRLLPMLRNARGSVVNIASIHATLTKPHFTCYAASKGALVSLTKALAVELAPEVRVNAILPAATDTPMLRDGFKGDGERLKRLGKCHPMGRIAYPEEIARVTLFLASSSGSFITGTVISIDGGIGAMLHDPVVV